MCRWTLSIPERKSQKNRPHLCSSERRKKKDIILFRLHHKGRITQSQRLPFPFHFLFVDINETCKKDTNSAVHSSFQHKRRMLIFLFLTQLVSAWFFGKFLGIHSQPVSPAKLGRLPFAETSARQA
jgi:hypothetical protein